MNFRQNIVFNIMRVVRFFVILIIAFIFSSCGAAWRILIYNEAELDDYKKFPGRLICKGDYTFHFFEKNAVNKLSCNIPAELNPGTQKSFEDILKLDKTVAFLMIRNDTIVYENYFDGYSKSEIINSFSISKSFVSLLAGIAISEGYIKNVRVKITDYIPELKRQGFDKITVEHLLNMCSGIKFNDGVLIPYTNIATYYYGEHLISYLRHLKTKAEPGIKFEYKDVNTLLLSIIISRATGRTLSEYMQEKIWVPMGMESDAKWIIDNRKNGIERSFCCMNAIARDYAKMGRLCLNKGKWNGKQVVSGEWIEKCSHQTIPGMDKYSYHFWLYKKDTYFAYGYRGQFVFINPKTNTIIVRIGDKEKKVNWSELLYYLSEQKSY